MNFLGHWWLNPKNESQILAGNFMGDFVKGKSYLLYPDKIQTGILLHRQIDSFTDNHPSTKAIRATLRPFCARFGWLAVDVLYDHFLSLDWQNYHSATLQEFVSTCIANLEPQEMSFPHDLKLFFFKLKQHGWALQYKEKDHLSRILLQMGKRTNFEYEAENLVENLDEILANIEAESQVFLSHAQTKFVGSNQKL